jgi:methionyl-tRNA synthetase
MQTNRYLEELWKVLTIANQSIATYEPWTKMKEGKEDEAMALVALVANLLAKVSVMLSPVMPKTCATISDALGFENNTQNFKNLIEDEKLLAEFVVKKVPPLFPKIEKELIQTKQTKQEPKQDEKKKDKKDEGIITIDQFFQTSLKIGTIIEAQEVKKSDRLLLLQVDLGEEKPRQIVAGIKEFYSPSELLNTQVCVVANLKPAKLMGMLSEGMLLAAKDKNGLSLLRPETPKEVGTKVS